MVNNSILIFSPVRQDAVILKYVLRNLEMLDKTDMRLSYWFYDDNTDQKSKALLFEFCERYAHNSLILPSLPLVDERYEKTDVTHQWNPSLVDRITTIKNYAIKQFLQTDNEFLFFLDSDIVLHPCTLTHLLGLNLDIVAEVFWTKFDVKKNYQPNVWDFHSYIHATPDSIIRLKQPGYYKVGGLGACTLISRLPLEKGVSFSKIYNLDFWGEDRHFCVRAACLGYELYADTLYPPFHVYRNSLIPELEQWLAQGMTRSYFDRWLDANWEKSIRASMTNKNRKPKKISTIFRQVVRIVKKELGQK